MRVLAALALVAAAAMGSGCIGFCSPHATEPVLYNATNSTIEVHLRMETGKGRVVAEGDFTVLAGRYAGPADRFKTFDGTLVAFATIDGQPYEDRIEFSECWGGVDLGFDGTTFWIGNDAS